MPSSEHFTVKGQSPYKQKNGVFEVEFAITEAKPTSEQIAQKSFLPLWREKSHLNIKNGEFEVKLGSQSNPLPEKISAFTSVWIIVVDQFSSVGSSFEFQVPETMRQAPPPKPDSEQKKSKQVPRSSSAGVKALLVNLVLKETKVTKETKVLLETKVQQDKKELPETKETKETKDLLV